MNEQGLLQGNDKRASWRSRCRARLSEHISEALGINILPEEVRLKTEDDTEYRWHIDDPSLEPLFQKPLSKHSVRVYMLLYKAIGHRFRAVHPKKAVEKTNEISLISKLEAEILTLMAKLKIATDEACQHETAAREAEAKIMEQNKVMREAQVTIQLHQQDISNWMALSEWYRAKCLECSDSLGYLIAFLQQTPSDIGEALPDQDQ